MIGAPRPDPRRDFSRYSRLRGEDRLAPPRPAASTGQSPSNGRKGHRRDSGGVKQPEGGLRERMRCSSLVDWPAYARFEGALCGLLVSVKVGGALKEEASYSQTRKTASPRMSTPTLCQPFER